MALCTYHLGQREVFRRLRLRQQWHLQHLHVQRGRSHRHLNRNSVPNSRNAILHRNDGIVHARTFASKHSSAKQCVTPRYMKMQHACRAAMVLIYPQPSKLCQCAAFNYFEETAACLSRGLSTSGTADQQQQTRELHLGGLR